MRPPAPTFTGYVDWIKLLWLFEPEFFHLLKWDTTTPLKVIIRGKMYGEQ